MREKSAVVVLLLLTAAELPRRKTVVASASAREILIEVRYLAKTFAGAYLTSPAFPTLSPAGNERSCFPVPLTLPFTREP